MRETELWRRLEHSVGESYARSWAMQVALPALQSRTVDESIRDGVPYKAIWEACWELLELPASEK